MQITNITISFDPEGKALIERLIAALESKAEPTEETKEAVKVVAQTAAVTYQAAPALTLAPDPVEEPPVVTAEVEAVVEAAPEVRHYTVEEVGKAGAALFDAGKIDPSYMTSVMKGKPLTKMTQEELDAIAADFIQKGAVI